MIFINQCLEHIQPHFVFRLEKQNVICVTTDIGKVALVSQNSGR